MTYNDANRLVTYNGQKVKYDEKGNMTYGPVDGVMQELTYDCRNRLVEAGGVSYTYDAENTRIATTEDGLTTEYVTDTGGSLSRLLVAYEADNTETTYYYGAEGLAAQYNSGTGKYYAYHYDNIGSTMLITARDGHAVERFSYGTYGELLKEPITKIRFLYNGSYGVATDSNGLYYMRARYYNPDIKRFINQDIKVGDIGSSQSLNRYAYCEGNPVSMVDPFGLCGEDANDQGKTSKYEKWHNFLGIAGIFWDGFDLINGALYAAEGDYVNAAISFACGIPAVGNIVAGVAKTSKVAKAMKTANKIADMCKSVGKAGNTAAGMKAAYDTYQTAQRECKTTTGKIAYMAGTLITGYAAGKAASWGANKLKNLANKALPKLKTAVQEGAGKLASKISKGFSSSGSGRMNRNRGFVVNPFYKGGSNPTGATFEGTIYRSVDSRYDPLEMSQYTIDSNHRYTEAGVPGLYFSSGEKIVKAELGNYDVFDFSNRTMYSYDVKLTNMLDVSNPSVRSRLGISLDSIIGESYDVTHAIGRYAYSNGYNGIIAPSARADGGVNIILFNTKGVK